MLKKRLILLIFTSLSLTFLESCNLNNINMNNTSIKKSSIYSINGKVSFDNYNIKASIEDIAINATVSLIYPKDYNIHSLRDKTISSGVTNQEGEFTIKTNNFSPELNTVYILEASRRINGIGNSLISLRTNLKWTGSSWKSITKDNIYINKKTTALSILSDLYSNFYNEIKLENIIGKLVFDNDIYNLDTTNNSLKDHFNFIYNIVDRSMINNIDPVKYINSSNSSYYPSVDSYESKLKANMETFRTLLETYAVDWGGVYPNNLDELAEEANIGNYNKLDQMFDPFYDDIKRPQLFLEYDEYESNKNTINKNDLKGVILYKMTTDPRFPSSEPYFTRYFIYGLNDLGELLSDYFRGNVYYLTNG